MKKIVLLQVILSSLFFPLAVDAQPKKHAENLPQDAMDQQTEYLDQLINSWYVRKRSVSQKEYDIDTAKTIEISDSVYLKRLFTMPTVVPMSFNKTVKQWIQFYTKNTKSRQYILGLSEYYMPFFEKILDKYNLPLELKYMSIIESALNPRARSRSGAVGLWQFMYGTGKMYGLEINSYVDERMDVLKSADAAARYMRDMYNIFGDWNLSIAAYNSGAGNVKKAIIRSGGKTNFWEIYPYLPRETRGYIPAYIGALYSMKYYQEHNIIPRHVDMQIVTDTVMINKKLHLKQVAEYLKIDYEKLTNLNPQYKREIIPGHYKSYPLRLPIENVKDFLDHEKEIYAYKDSIYLNTKVDIKRPSKNLYARSHYTPSGTRGRKKLYYTIKSGDTYSDIAGWYDVSTRDLQSWNNVSSRRLRVGKKIAVWVPKSKYSKYLKVNQMSSAQKRKTSTNIKKAPQRKATASSGKYIRYKIKNGDNLWNIAKKYEGVSAQDIKKINRFSDADIRNLKVGQIIIIKSK
ncbi:MAG: lytic transglycosylase [Bacteroidia bacterium]|nr:MAG: lytic transglycosylase [Bacteroidia bacterium]